MTLIGKLASTYQRLSALPAKLGDPRYSTVAIRDASGTTVLEPDLKTTKIDPRKVGAYLSESVSLLGDEYVISGVPRVYSQERLERCTYLIFYDRQTGEGTLADLVDLSDRDVVNYQLIVRPRSRGK